MGLFDWIFGRRRLPPAVPAGPRGGAGGGELQGTWKLVSCESGGRAVDPAGVYDKVLIRGDQYLAYRGEEAVAFFILEVDDRKDPKRIDFTHPAEEPFLGIYAREGDALRLCWDGTRPGTRPETFTGASTCMALGLLRFEAFTAEAALIQGTWTVLAMEENGAPVPAGTRLTAIEITGGELILTRADGARLVMALSLNPLTAPKSLGIVADAGDGGMVSLAGLYATDGDRLRLCWRDSGHGPPAGFETTAAPPSSSFLLKRAEAPAS